MSAQQCIDVHICLAILHSQFALVEIYPLMNTYVNKARTQTCHMDRMEGRGPVEHVEHRLMRLHLVAVFDLLASVSKALVLPSGWVPGYIGS